MDSLYTEIGKRMRLIRKMKRLTQAQVAETAGIDESFYGQIERGVNVPSLRTFLSIAEALRVEANELLPKKRSIKYVYKNLVENLISNIPTSKRKIVVGMISDIVARFNKSS